MALQLDENLPDEIKNICCVKESKIFENFWSKKINLKNFRSITKALCGIWWNL